ncbi:hypothetical protein [Halorarius halobius]|uniref:hypothetical protein n=1 Tax=Halorarius halobius TaxID=2962671 RepID=UPI0020CD758F|nr:hypothetical protein [Halorarius halobius]
MSQAAPPEIVDIDADAALEAALNTEATVHSLVEFDKDEFNPLYVSEATRGLYESDDEMAAHFERIHGYVNIDFMETDLFTVDLFDAAERVRYKVTALDVVTIVRLYLDDNTGLFIAIERGDAAEPLVAAIEQSLTE